MSKFPIVIDLDVPVTHGDEQISRLCITRAMRAGDLRGVSVNAMTFDDIFLVASRLTGVPVSVITQMSMSDTVRLQEVIGDFFGSGL